MQFSKVERKRVWIGGEFLGEIQNETQQVFHSV